MTHDQALLRLRARRRRLARAVALPSGHELVDELLLPVLLRLPMAERLALALAVAHRRARWARW